MSWIQELEISHQPSPLLSLNYNLLGLRGRSLVREYKGIHDIKDYL